MLAPSVIPNSYKQWNAKHGAPYGRPLRYFRFREPFMSEEQIRRARGPFSIQINNSTREFEYPWAFEAGNLQPRMKVLEIGGGLSGFPTVEAAGRQTRSIVRFFRVRQRQSIEPSRDLFARPRLPNVSAVPGLKKASARYLSKGRPPSFFCR